MRSPNDFQNLLRDLFGEMQPAQFGWQLAVLMLSLAVAWLIQTKFAPRPAAQTVTDMAGTSRIRVGSMNRLALPLCALLGVVIGRWVLLRWQGQPTVLLNVAIPLLFSFALIRISVYTLRRTFLRQAWVRPWERLLAWGMWLGVALYLTGVLPEVLEFLDGMDFHVGKQRVSVLLLAQGVLSIAVTLLGALWLGGALQDRIMNTLGLNMNLRVMLAKVINALLVLLGVLVALSLVGIDLTVLSVFGGALGVGLGLGLQKIASNYVSGFIILLDNSLRIGDALTVDKYNGKVTALTTRYVVLKANDGTEALIPNDTFVTSPVVNQSYSDRLVRLALPVQISYDSNLETAMNIMLSAATNQPQVLADPASQVFLKEFAENGINLELNFWVEDPQGGQLPLRSKINMEIWREFQKQGIKIPFPQREVRMVGDEAGR